ncbi:MAG: hypothetical protein JWO92_2480 [Chitinophagaceae bacterium]|nr:hypothetical protein [Chitinophagaceae bacterium]
MLHCARLLVISIVVTSIISCKKNSTTTSLDVNTLGGSPGSCTSSTFAGIYTKGVSFNGSQTVTIQVNVKVAPTSIIISTPIVNGVFFSNSSTQSTFTTLGVQNIVLAGQGTPSNSGTYNFTVTLYRSFSSNDISSCSFSLNFN